MNVIPKLLFIIFSNTDSLYHAGDENLSWSEVEVLVTFTAAVVADAKNQ